MTSGRLVIFVVGEDGVKTIDFVGLWENLKQKMEILEIADSLLKTPGMKFEAVMQEGAMQ